MARNDSDENPYASPESSLATQYDEGPVGAVRYGGFLTRFLALILDAILSSIIGAVIGGVFGGVMGASGVDLKTIELMGNVIGVVIGWMYFALQESSDAQATLGKRAMGLRVIDETTGRKLTFGQATGRHFGKILSGLILLIGYLMQPFTQKRQALHDMLAKTLVIKG